MTSKAEPTILNHTLEAGAEAQYFAAHNGDKEAAYRAIGISAACGLARLVALHLRERDFEAVAYKQATRGNPPMVDVRCLVPIPQTTAFDLIRVKINLSQSEAVQRSITAPEPYGADGLAHIASDPIARSSIEALMRPSLWKRTAEGLPYYDTSFGNPRSGHMWGRISYQIMDADSPETASLKYANQVLAQFGLETARLHVMLLAYATNQQGVYTLSRQQVYTGLGLHASQRKDLSREEKDERAFRAIDNLKSFGYTVHGIDFKRAKGKKAGDGYKGDTVKVRETRGSRFWSIDTTRSGQGRFLDDEGRLIERVDDDWGVLVSPGPWVDLFLRGSGELPRQTAVISKDEFERWCKKTEYAQALWIHLQLAARIHQGGPVELTKREIIQLAGGDIENSTKDQRKGIRSKLACAIDELEADNWGIDEHSLREGANPPKKPTWEQTLEERITFTPPEFLRKQYAPIATRAALLDSGRNRAIKAKEAAAEKWTQDRIKDLIDRAGSNVALAKLLGVTPPAVSQLKAQDRKVSPKMAAKLTAVDEALKKQGR